MAGDLQDIPPLLGRRHNGKLPGLLMRFSRTKSSKNTREQEIHEIPGALEMQNTILLLS